MPSSKTNDESSDGDSQIHKGDLKGLSQSRENATRPLNLGAIRGLHNPIESSDFDIDPQLDALFVDSPASDSSPREHTELVLGDYVLESVLGAGGMGQVFKAKHRTMDRWVAVKVLPNKFVNQTDLVDRFHSEIRAVGKLMHPNIVTAFDAGCHDGVHYLVMELIEGNLLSSLVSADGPMTTEMVVPILSQAATALDYAHSLGVIHRDIKPSNLMLTHAGVLKILDFGLARLSLQAAELEKDRRRQLMGTVQYMSPEQINAPDTVDHRSDLYSLGATLFYLLTGRPMFEGEPVQTALAQVKSKPSALYEVRGDIDLRLDSIFQRLVAKSPTDRFATGGMLLEAMQSLNLISSLPSNSVRDRARSTIGSKSTRENPTDGFRSESTSLKKYYAVGLELGVLQSRVSFIDSRHMLREVILDGQKKTLSHMVWCDSDRLLVGKSAGEARIKSPQHIFYGFQRWFGLPMLERTFAGKQTPPEVLLASVIKHMMNSAEKEQSGITHAVVTIPASYDQLQRRCVIQACQIAGLEVLQLLEKPLAAALSHIEFRVALETSKISSEASSPTHFLVCTLNGTACEATVVRVTGRRVESMGSVGDWKRGVLRWHHRLAEYLSDWLVREHKVDIKNDLTSSSRLQRFVESCFDQLVVQGHIEAVFDLNNRKFPVRINPLQLMKIVDSLQGDLHRFANSAIEVAGIQIGQIDEVLLIGDLLQLPVVRNSLSGLFPADVPCHLISQAMLAKGAAIQSQYLLPPGNPKSPFAEAATVYDFGLVVQHRSQRLSTPKLLIAKQTTLPSSISKTLRFASSKEAQPIIQFVEASRLGGVNWNRLGGIDLGTCFPDRPPTSPLQLRIDVDSSGLWHGSITWLAQNITRVIPSLEENTIDESTRRQWKEWVESLLLCRLED